MRVHDLVLKRGESAMPEDWQPENRKGPPRLHRVGIFLESLIGFGFEK
jgi:hypothetical protein